MFKKIVKDNVGLVKHMLSVDQIANVLFGVIYFVMCKYMMFDVFYSITKEMGEIKGAAIASVACVMIYMISINTQASYEKYVEKAKAQDQAQNKTSSENLHEA